MNRLVKVVPMAWLASILAPSVLSPVVGGNLPVGEVQSVLTLPVGNTPEGVAVGQGGDVYVGNRYRQGNLRFGEVLKLDGSGSAKVIASFEGTPDPFATGLLGLAVDKDDNVYAALDNRIPSSHGVWKISGNGQKVERLVGSEQIPFPNSITLDESGNLYVTDSSLGEIWTLPEKGVAMDRWVQHAALAPLLADPVGFPLPGANGIAFSPPHNLYVANTEQALIARVTILPDGSAGAVDVVAAGFPLLTVDGISVDAQGGIHAVIAGYAVLGVAPLVHVDPTTGQVTPTVFDPAAVGLFDVPLSLAFGGAGAAGKTVFITNGDLPIVPGGPGPGLIQAGVGVPGYRGN